MGDQITVKLYSPFSDIAGCRQVTLSVTHPMSAADTLRLLGDRYPALKPYVAEGGQQGGAFLLVVNGRLTSLDDVVHSGDEIFLCAQVSGG
jgi:molybdopterin converting factor small subunit